jgi:hypothetical protein
MMLVNSGESISVRPSWSRGNGGHAGEAAYADHGRVGKCLVIRCKQLHSAMILSVEYVFSSSYHIYAEPCLD